MKTDYSQKHTHTTPCMKATWSVSSTATNKVNLKFSPIMHYQTKCITLLTFQFNFFFSSKTYPSTTNFHDKPTTKYNFNLLQTFLIYYWIYKRQVLPLGPSYYYGVSDCNTTTYLNWNGFLSCYTHMVFHILSNWTIIKWTETTVTLNINKTK